MSKYEFEYSSENHDKFLSFLEEISDKKFKEFTQKLLVTKYRVIGIKVPILRELAKQIGKNDLKGYIQKCTFSSYEETLIFGLLLNNLSIDEIIEKFRFYSKKIDSWGFTDIVISSLKKVKKNKERFLPLVEELMLGEEFSVRSAFVFLLDYYICDEYIDNIFDKLKIEFEGYYVKMSKAWLLSVIYLSYPDKVKDFLSNCTDKFTVNKTISKIRDSFRVSDINKKELLAYKR